MIATEQKFWAPVARTNLAELRAAAAAAWRPTRLELPSAWCPSHVRLSPEVEAQSGPLDLANRPWWRDVLDDMADPEVCEVSVPAATQVGKTLSLVAMILWCAVNAPAPAMIVTPDRDSANEFRDRVYGNALASPTLKHLVPAQRKWNMRWIDLGRMRIYLAWSGSKQRLRGRRCKYVFRTEVDAYTGDKKTGDPIKATNERVKAFHRYFIFTESSPVEDPSTIAGMEATSDDRLRWHAKCPECGHWQELRFFPHRSGDFAGCGGIGGLQDENENWRSPDEARLHGHYVCERGCRIDEDRRLAFIRAGRWLSRGQSLDKKGRVVGDGPTSKRRRGRHLWSIHSDTITFGRLAAEYLQHKSEGKLAEFWGNWLGLAYAAKTKMPSWEQLARRLAAVNCKGEVPAEAWFLTAGGDVQEDRVKWSVRAWAPQVTSWLVDWGEFRRSEGDSNDLVKSDLDQIGRRLLGRTYPVCGKNPLGCHELSIRLFNCDANHRTIDVHNWMCSLPVEWVRGDAHRVRAVRGDHKVDPDVRFRMNVVEQNTRSGEKYEGGLELWGIYIYMFYQDLTQRLVGDRDKPGSWHVTKDALALGKEYLQEVTNFHRVVQVKPNGDRKGVWQPINKLLGVDFWDTEIYSLAGAHMIVGDLGWTEQAWRNAWLPKPQAPLRRRRMDTGVGIADR